MPNALKEPVSRSADAHILHLQTLLILQCFPEEAQRSEGAEGVLRGPKGVGVSVGAYGSQT